MAKVNRRGMVGETQRIRFLCLPTRWWSEARAKPPRVRGGRDRARSVYRPEGACPRPGFQTSGGWLSGPLHAWGPPRGGP